MMHRIFRILLLITAAITIAAGCNSYSSASATSGITGISNMTGTRAAHTSTLLPDGNVLIAGGFGSGSSRLAGAELFNPGRRTFTSIGDMSVSRSGHTATLLPNGKVLIAGGYNGDYLSSAELYDPAARTFRPTNTMHTARSGHVAVLLPNGKVLLAGGVGTGWTFLKDAEIYDPGTNSFTATGEMLAARESHTATLLPNGKVLIAGGHKDRREAMTVYSSAEIYDPAIGKFSATGDMTRVRHKHGAVLLADGRVLIVGGADKRDGRPAYSSVEIYDPARGAFSAAGDMNSQRYKLQDTIVLLNNGKVLIAGGANRAEVFDPATKSFSYVTGDMGASRQFAAATRLRNGQVLITGGYHGQNEVSAQAWLFRS
jgi:galactose oxidase-like protein/Kelch motif protein